MEAFTEKQKRESKLLNRMTRGDIFELSRDMAREMDIFSRMMELYPYTWTLSQFIEVLTGRRLEKYPPDHRNELYTAFLQICVDADSEYYIQDVEIWNPGSKSHEAYTVSRRYKKDARRKAPRKRGEPLLNGKPENGLGVLWH